MQLKRLECKDRELNCYMSNVVGRLIESIGKLNENENNSK